MTTGILTKLIDESLITRIEERRDYIGASSIGHPCERKIWYEFNDYEREPYSQKQLRTFAIGKRLESMILDCLMNAGLDLITTTFDLFDQSLFIFQGHLDAIWYKNGADKEPRAIIEVKTARDSSFNIFVKKGLREWQSSYYAQIQAYMGMSGIHEGYVIALNKDTSEIHDEQVFFDEYYYDDLKRKVMRVIEAKEPLPKINNNSLYFVCRGCPFKGICHS